MGITADGWIDWAERVPGHTEKVNGWLNPVAGFVAHSAEGWEAYLRSNPPQTAAVGGRKSWHLSNLLDGRLLQHYPIYAQCWASGATLPNNSFVAMEHEGVAPVPLTPAQTRTTTLVIQELAAIGGWNPQRQVNLWEHRECTRWGAEPTACPSNRIPWDVILAAPGGDPLDPVKEDALDRRNALVALLAVLTGEGATIGIRPIAPDDYSAVVLQHRDGREWGPIPIDNLPSYFSGAPWL